MKTRTSSDGLRRVWYDPSIRLYVMQHVDGQGNQTPGEVEYTSDKMAAAKHLVPQSWSGPDSACCTECGAQVNAGRLLSSIRSERKAAASRSNGAKGGRPTLKANRSKSLQGVGKAPRRLLVAFVGKEEAKTAGGVRTAHIETVEPV